MSTNGYNTSNETELQPPNYLHELDLIIHSS